MFRRQRGDFFGGEGAAVDADFVEGADEWFALELVADAERELVHAAGFGASAGGGELADRKSVV